MDWFATKHTKIRDYVMALQTIERILQDFYAQVPSLSPGIHITMGLYDLVQLKDFIDKRAKLTLFRQILDLSQVRGLFFGHHVDRHKGSTWF